MVIPQELREVAADLNNCEANLSAALSRLEHTRVAYTRLDRFSGDFYSIDTQFRIVLREVSELLRLFQVLFNNIENEV